MKTKAFIIAGFLCLTAAASKAQEFTIKSIELTAEQVIVYYDLVDTTKNRTYTVFVYSSRDNFLAPLTKLSGDVGMEVKPGKNRRVVWSSKEELGAAFDGDVELEIRGRVYVPFIRFEGFEDIAVRKRTVPFLVKWSGGSRQNILDFQLWRGEKLVYTFPNVPNAYEYKLVIPRSVKPGDDYYLKIADTKNKEQVVVTPKFIVKRKIPLVAKVVTLLGLGYLTYVLTKGPEEIPDVKEAPGPPN